MNWNTDPEITADESNLNDEELTHVEEVSAHNKQEQEDKPIQNKELNELLICQGAKCTCDKAVDPSPKPLHILSHNKYIINDNGENKLVATTLENK